MSPHAGSKSSGPDTDTRIRVGSFILPPWEGRRAAFQGRREHSAVLTARTEDHLGAVRLHGIIRDSTGINIPYNKIHQILRDEDLASEHPKEEQRDVNGYALSAPIRTPCGTQTTSTSMTVDGSCAMRTTHHVLSQGTACLSTPLPKTRWPCLRRP